MRESHALLSYEICFEAAVCGAVIQLEQFDVTQLGLLPTDFSKPMWAKVWAECLDLWANAGRIDVVSVVNNVNDYRAEIWSVVDVAVAPAQVNYYANALKDQVTKRKVMELLDAMQRQAPGMDDVDELVVALQADLKRLERTKAVDLPLLQLDVQSWLKNLREPSRALPTCFPRINDMIVGLKPGSMYVIGARPSVGKTLVGMQIAFELAEQDHDVLFFSLEMDKDSLLNRVMADYTGIEVSMFEKSMITPEMSWQIVERMKTLKNRLMIHDLAGLSLAQIKAFAKAVKAQRPLKAIFIDYLQLIQGADKSNLYQKITEISQGVKILAKELDVPVVVLAQLNRSVAGKPEAIPGMHDLRDSGAIEQDADVIVLLSRSQSDESVARDMAIAAGSHPEVWRKGEKDLITLDVVKNRNGATGQALYRFDGAFARVRELQR